MTVSERLQPSAGGRVSPRPANAAALQAFLANVFLAAGVLGLWLLGHSYEGIVHDARLYVGHVLAASDPQGVGQDIMFRKDGQFDLTLFPLVLSWVIDAAGVSLGAKLMSLAGLVLWIAAMGSLAAAMAEGRLRWVILIFVVVLPAGYGGFAVFNYAEPIATPRVFAEACVLLAFALICRKRLLMALLPLVGAALLHPIMALPGFGVWVWCVFFDPRSRVLPLRVAVVCAVAAAALMLVAAALNMPLVERLFVGIDPAFREIVLARTRDLFPGLWPLGDWSVFCVHAAILAVTTAVVSGPVRSLFTGGLVVGLGGVGASLLLGGALNSLLAVQAQLWRSAWVVAALAAAGLAICAVELWRQGGRARLTLGFLVVAWLGASQPVVGIPAALLAVISAFLPSVGRLSVLPRMILGVWSFVALYALSRFGMSVYALALYLENRPEEGTHLAQLLGELGVWTIPVCTLAVMWMLMKRKTPLPRPIAAAIAVIVLVLGVTSWDVRTSWTMASDTAAGDPALKALLSAHDGEVLWLDGRFQTWSFAGRPNWVSAMQGASVIFSRPLALEWDRRVRRLIGLGLTNDKLRDVFTSEKRASSAAAHLAHLNDARLEKLCGSADAPAWLIAPAGTMKNSNISPSRWTPSYWKAPGARHSFKWDGKEVEWTTTQDYVVIPCAS